MQERIERADAPDMRAREHDRDALLHRLEQLADGHPSSDCYRDADNNRPDHRDDRLSAPERARTGWEASEVRDHPDRPAESDVHLAADRARHILEGDNDSAGGGHRHGTGRPGKTEFPEDWPDSEILSVIDGVGRRPDHVEWQPNGRWRVAGDHDGVRVNVVMLTDARIWTAWPEPGGKGVVQNPEAS